MNMFEVIRTPLKPPIHPTTDSILMIGEVGFFPLVKISDKSSPFSNTMLHAFSAVWLKSSTFH